MSKETKKILASQILRVLLCKIFRFIEEIIGKVDTKNHTDQILKGNSTPAKPAAKKAVKKPATKKVAKKSVKKAAKKKK